MGKIRVYKLAHELGKNSVELVDILQDLGLNVSSHMSTVNEDMALIIRDMFKDDEKLKEDENEVVEKKSSDNKDKFTDERERKNGDEIKLALPITVKELAKLINYKSNDLIKNLIDLGIMANINHPLDEEIINKLVSKLNINIKITKENKVKKDDSSRIGPQIIDKPENLKIRPPIITVMGHVDHGKTTLLDVIRNTNVAKNEAGGITQHIGAYQVEIDGKKMTFIDTPGHEAFTAMRARGARITDIAILVVAADDGVMPQTIEAINHAKAADIPVVVAINKIDKPNAQPDKVKQELTEYGLVSEDWGGDTICVNISALKGKNIDKLLEMVLLVAEMEELKANPDRLAEGIIIEAELDKGWGPVATVLVKNGTMRIGDSFIAGITYGRVRAMVDDAGNRLELAGPSKAVEVIGFSEVPAAGDFVQVLESEKEARQIAGERHQIHHDQELNQDVKVSLEDLYQQIQDEKIKELSIIIKADVQGSIEALRDSLLRLGTDEVGVNVIHTGVGAINETDVIFASASNAIILGFNVIPDSNARKIIEKEKVDVRLYRVIYKVIEDIKNALAGLLEPEIKEKIIGRAEVRATFKVPNVGTVAGIYVNEGIINRNAQVRLLRDNVIIFEGKISSLKRFENDVREVKEGYECGLGIEGYNDIKDGDNMDIFIYEEIKRSL
jgi:translation initiation factor IF-2